jgi:hypothetical protein
VGDLQIASSRSRHTRRGHTPDSVGTVIPDGSWGLFRLFIGGAAPAPGALDGKRVIVQLRAEADPETGGQYTLKRWRVTKHSADGGVEQIELRPDNPGFVPKKYTAEDGDIRAVAEFLEVVG